MAQWVALNMRAWVRISSTQAKVTQRPVCLCVCYLSAGMGKEEKVGAGDVQTDRGCLIVSQYNWLQPQPMKDCLKK